VKLWGGHFGVVDNIITNFLIPVHLSYLVLKFQIIKYTMSSKSCIKMYIICSDVYADMDIFIDNYLSITQQVRVSHCSFVTSDNCTHRGCCM